MKRKISYLQNLDDHFKGLGLKNQKTLSQLVFDSVDEVLTFDSIVYLVRRFKN